MTMARELVETTLGGDGRRDGRPGRRVTVNIAESPLGWLRARGLVTPRQFDAGEQLRNDFERASLGPSVTMRWDASGVKGARHGSNTPDLTTRQFSAKARFDAAIAAAGPGLADILWRTVCACETIPDAERALGWPARSGRLVLTLALDRIATHYRIE